MLLDLAPCEGSHFQLATFERVSYEGADASPRGPVIEHGVASPPSTAFYRGRSDRKVIRFCFAKREGTSMAAERLRRSAG